MNRPQLDAVLAAVVIFLVLVYVVTFAKLCPAAGGCRRIWSAPRDRFCRDCGRRLIWWWKVAGTPSYLP